MVVSPKLGSRTDILVCLELQIDGDFILDFFRPSRGWTAHHILLDLTDKSVGYFRVSLAGP